MKAISQKWNAFFFNRFDPISIGMFRIFLGTLITLFYFALFPNWETYYSAEGILYTQDKWSLFYWTEGRIPMGVFWWVGFISALSFTLGYRTRLFTLLLFVLQCSLIHRTSQVVNGEDLIFRMVLFYSLFAPLGNRLSLDHWLKSRKGKKSKSEKPFPMIWATRALQINFLLVYLISLPNKVVDDSAWWNGDAIYLAMISNMWSRWPWPEWFYLYDGLWSKVFTYGTLLIEGMFPILVWMKKSKLIILLALASLHIGIAVVLNGVAFFSLSMVVCLWIFVPPETTHTLLRFFKNPAVSTITSNLFAVPQTRALLR